jgi:hypothetical protein
VLFDPPRSNKRSTRLQGGKAEAEAGSVKRGQSVDYSPEETAPASEAA